MYKQALSDCILKRITISQPNLNTVLSYFKEQEVHKDEILLGEASKRMYFKEWLSQDLFSTSRWRRKPPVTWLLKTISLLV
ncbi:hypothetical protein CS542_02325 [Pedobacter sp. IW39]|nr:hypothetical protein CS542_02325 [Pedobacter sp. IW39]